MEIFLSFPSNRKNFLPSFLLFGALHLGLDVAVFNDGNFSSPATFFLL